MSESRSRRPFIIGAVVLVVLIGLGAVAWFLFLRDDAEPELTISDSANATGEVVDLASLAGSWTVVPGSGDDATTAGYRVKEQFAGVASKQEATGRTADVTGSITIDGDEVSEASFTVDMTTLKSNRDRRDNAIRGDGLQTDEFPEGTFELTEPISLPEVRDGKVFETKADGDLTLHGVTKAISLTVSAKVTGDTIVVQGSAPVEMADYDINPPNRAGFVSVDDNGTFEFVISLQQG